ncbi:hypothetical protein WN982_26700 [Paraburkholderia sp. IMGN_8]|uniref:hypothetical protein n=1 Tax=Paraburkholderia sp. IMGN_8 TaxID=3136564 RepID=UPI003100F86F
MPYQTPFADLIFPDESGRPCTQTYRVILTDTPDRLAVIHLRHVNASDQSPASSSIVRDQILKAVVQIAINESDRVSG